MIVLPEEGFLNKDRLEMTLDFLINYYEDIIGTDENNKERISTDNSTKELMRNEIREFLSKGYTICWCTRTRVDAVMHYSMIGEKCIIDMLFVDRKSNLPDFITSAIKSLNNRGIYDINIGFINKFIQRTIENIDSKDKLE